MSSSKPSSSPAVPSSLGRLSIATASPAESKIAKPSVKASQDSADSPASQFARAEDLDFLRRQLEQLNKAVSELALSRSPSQMQPSSSAVHPVASGAAPAPVPTASASSALSSVAPTIAPDPTAATEDVRAAALRFLESTEGKCDVPQRSLASKPVVPVVQALLHRTSHGREYAVPKLVATAGGGAAAPVAVVQELADPLDARVHEHVPGAGAHNGGSPVTDDEVMEALNNVLLEFGSVLRWARDPQSFFNVSSRVEADILARVIDLALSEPDPDRFREEVIRLVMRRMCALQAGDNSGNWRLADVIMGRSPFARTNGIIPTEAIMRAVSKTASFQSSLRRATNYDYRAARGRFGFVPRGRGGGGAGRGQWQREGGQREGVPQEGGKFGKSSAPSGYTGGAPRQ